jgi:stage V sporulation protein AD
MEFNNAYLYDTATVTGPLEKDGPLGAFFDKNYDELHCGEDSWEKAEMRLMADAIDILLQKTGLETKDVDYVLAGDLVNQVVISNYVMRDLDAPYLGIYGACSTSVEGMVIGAALADGGFGNKIICTTSSHNATSERQFRNPTEYGGQKPPSTTYTITGAAAGLITNAKSNIRIRRATVGRVVDPKLKDPFDMGRAMAPAAAQTLMDHLTDFNASVNDYDFIATGDLSKFGSQVFKDILREHNIDVSRNYQDCGLMIYDINRQPVFAGGSGCGCCGVVSYGYLYHQLLTGKIKSALIIATGALLNPIITAQKETIPGIAHAVVLERVVK